MFRIKGFKAGEINTDFTIETDLRDGTPVLIRHLRPDDARLLEIGMEHLSPQSKYFRFFNSLSKLPSNMLHQLTEIDHVNHEALGALDVTTSNPDPIGIARYIRSPEKKSCAEVAVTVVDEHQQKGLGTILLALLAYIALRNDINEFTAVVLSNNMKMLQVFKELGAVITRDDEQQVNVCFPLFKDSTNYPSTSVGEVFRRVAKSIETNTHKGAVRGMRPGLRMV